MAPTNLTGSANSTTQINLSWTDNATNEDGYKIERKTGSGNYAVVGSTGANISTFSDMGLTANTTYTYRVYAHNSAGNSPQYSNEVTVTTGGVPTLTTTTISSVTAVGSVSGGEITDDGGSNITTRGVVWSTSANPTISLSTKTTDGSGTGSFTSNISGLDANTTYYVRAYATNSTGTGYGNEISFTTSNIDITTGLIGYWPFNGNANDESGNGNNGTVNGNITYNNDRNNNSLSSCYFDGASFINLPSLNSIPYKPTTYSLWINPTSLVTQNLPNGNAVAFIGRDLCGQGQQGQFGIWNNPLTGINQQILFYMGTSGVIFNYTPNLNNWIHLTFTWDQNDTMKLYVNGDFIQSMYHSSVGFAPNTIIPFRFGAGAGNCSNNNYVGRYFWNGSLDDIRIYNRALTADEVSYLYTH